ncbi:hypothetical protein KDL29_13240 [bacterium]|nr:hypothetical protein [bacterium]MCB1219039.1 hypothetical protein [bacterium]UNM09740.1 MAG: hypothetical protein H7A35_06675 [Planctomycetales bacterium]
MDSHVGQAQPDNAELQRREAAKWEGIAFTFCKAATLAFLAMLLAGPKYVLTLIALGTVFCYVVMMWHGRMDTRCFAKSPPLICGFWGAVALGAGYCAWAGIELPSILRLGGWQ